MPVKKIVPNERPKIDEAKAKLYLQAHHIMIGATKFYEPVALLGIRGYYARTMGATPANEINIYDDCICVITPNVFAAFNANCDPSVMRRGMAALVPGCYTYGLGMHKGAKLPAYKAVVQVGPVTVTREGIGEVSDDPPRVRFGINIHKGGFNNTSSEGCQTVYPTQYDLFLKAVETECKRYGRTRFPYVLVEE